MPPTTKTRPPVPTYARLLDPWGGVGSWSIAFNRVPEWIETTSSKPNAKGKYSTWNKCTHVKLETPSQCTWFNPYNRYSIQYKDHHHIYDVPVESIKSFGLSKVYIGLDFIEDNSFELIPFLVDWDDTLAMFSKKFLKELSYGSVTWGVLPFMSDLRSLASSLDAINGKIASSYEKLIGKRITRRFNWTHSIPSSWNPGALRYDIEGKTVISGYMTGDNVYPDSVSKAMAVFLDEIGLHLDLKTAWDVIPLSFVIDYFLPVGDLLESCHPRGWFNPQFSFTGGLSVSADIKAVWQGGGFTGSPAKYSLYIRDYLPNALFGSRPPVHPEFTAPSFRELFNTAYLMKKK